MRGETAHVFDALQKLATEAGIEVRIEPFTLQMAGKGGLCRIERQRVILVDARLSLLEQVGVIGEALGRALARHACIPPELTPYLATGHAKVARLAYLRPLARARPDS